MSILLLVLGLILTVSSADVKKGVYHTQRELEASVQYCDAVLPSWSMLHLHLLKLLYVIE